MSYELLTTNQAARLLGVSRPLVIQWIDSGKRNGYRIPGSTSRRIPRDSLLAFAKEHGIPVLTEPSHRLLIVDDEPDFSEPLRRQLEQRGWEVETAADAFEAGKLVSDFRPWAVLLDIRLKEVDGRKVCELIRKDPLLAGVRILAISAYLDDREGSELTRQGFDGFLRKPFSVNDLVERLGDAFRPTRTLSAGRQG